MQLNKQDEKLFQELLKKYKQGIISGLYPGNNITFTPTGCRDKIISSTGGGASGGIESIVAGTNITIDDTDPQNPIISATGGGSPAGSDTQIQYNNAGAFGADSDFTFDDSNKLFKVKDTANTYDLISIGSPATVNEASFGWRGNHDAGSFLMFQGSTPNEFKLYTDGVQKVYINSNQFLVGLDHMPLSAVVFTGSGLNDLVRSGTFSGTYPTTYTITIDGINKDYVQFTTSSISGSGFTVGETITSSSGGSATIDAINLNSSGEYTYLVLSGVTGTFLQTDVITGGTSSTTATLDSDLGQQDTFSWTDGTNSGSLVIAKMFQGALLSNSLIVYFDIGTGNTLADSWTWTYSYVNQNVLDFSNNDYKFQSTFGTDTFGYQIRDNLLGAGITGSANTYTNVAGDLGLTGFTKQGDDIKIGNLIQLASGESIDCNMSGGISGVSITETVDNGIGSKTVYDVTADTLQFYTDLSSAYHGISQSAGVVTLGNLSGGNNTKITIDDVNEQITISNLSAYDDDTAAGVGGLTAGMVYMTTGSGSAPLNAAGILMIKQ